MYKMNWYLNFSWKRLELKLQSTYAMRTKISEYCTCALLTSGRGQWPQHWEQWSMSPV